MADSSDVILRIKVLADATAAATGLDKASQSASKWQSGLKKAALPAAAAGAALVALGKKAVSSASDLQQSQGAVEAVFGKNAGAVEKNSRKAAKAMGLSAAAYQNYAALVGTSLQNAGFTASQAVAESNKVMQRGADLSALYGGTTADAVDAINAAVSRSEFDPLEKYGVSLNMTAVNAELAAKGQDKLTGAALATAKKQVILEQIYKDTGKAAGQYAREADSVAGRQQTMNAEIENASAAIGKVLLPIVAAAAKQLSKMAGWAEKNATTVQILAGVVGALAAAILLANAALKVAAIVQGIWNLAQVAGSKAALGTRIQLVALAVAEYAKAAATWVGVAATTAATAATYALGAAMKFLSANPILLIVLAVVAVAAALYLAYKRSATFRAFVQAMWSAIQAAARATWRVISGVWSAVLAAGRAVWNALRTGFAAAFSVVAAYARTYMAVVRTVIGLVRTAVGGVSSAVSSLIGWIKRIKVPGTISSAFDTIKTAVGRAASAVDSLIGWIGRIKAPPGIGSAFDTLRSAIDKVIGSVRSLIGWLGKIKVPKIPKGLNPFSRSAAAAPSAASPSLASFASPLAARAPAVSFAGVGARAVTSGTLVINVNGALDPEAVARQIKRVVGSHERRIGMTAT